MTEDLKITGIAVASIPVTDLAASASWYRTLLDLPYMREFGNAEQGVTGCSIGSLASGFLISFRRRDTTAGLADLRGEHPVILRVADRDALERVRERAERLGYRPDSGEHSDAAWVEVVDPDGIALRLAYVTVTSQDFVGVRFGPDDAVELYSEPLLPLDSGLRIP